MKAKPGPKSMKKRGPKSKQKPGPRGPAPVTGQVAW